MLECQIKLLNEIKCQITGLSVLDKNLLYSKLALFIPSAIYQPKYKLGQWDGKIHYFESNGQTYINLLQDMFKLVSPEKYSFSLIPYEGYQPVVPFELVDEKFFADHVWEKGHRLEGQPVMLDEHQVMGINALLQNQKGMICFSTGSGKTLISAVLAKKVCERGKFLIIVPSRDLVVNTASQLNLLGIQTGTAFEDDRIEEYSKQCVVTTWQGIHSMYRRSKGENVYTKQIKDLERKQNKAHFSGNKEEFERIRVNINELKRVSANDITKATNELNTLKQGVVGFLFDETHLAKASVAKQILTEMFPFVKIRWGCTGTIPKDKADQYCLITSIGPVVARMSSKELQDKNFLASCDIKMIKMIDSRMFLNYTDEYENITVDIPRLTYMARYIDKITRETGNTLVLVNRIKQGEILLKELNKLQADAIFLDGEDTVKKRTTEYKKINEAEHKIILATAQIASTGINIPRLFNLVLLDYGKSFVKVMQSVGRALRLGSDKTHATVHDISATTKYAKKHYRERKKYYIEENLPVEEISWSDWEGFNLR